MSALLINALPSAGENVILLCQVDYFDDNDTPITIIPPKIVPLVADKTTCVDINGMIVPCGSPEAVTNEFDFFMQMLKVPVIIEDMVTQKIRWADSEDRFN